MELILAAVGRLRPACRDLCDDYLGRLRSFQAIREIETREAGRAGSVALQQRAEGEALLAALPTGCGVTLLDVTGVNWSSEDLASQLDRWRLAARPHVVVIGGAVGVSDAVRERAETRWSLGRQTLPHELARVVVAEQLYRASTILRGTPYHKG